MVNTINSYAHVTTGGTTQVYTGACTLVAIVVNTTAAGTVGIKDGIDTNGAQVCVLKASAAEGTYTYNVTLGTGLRFTNASTGDYTVVYRVH